MTKREELEKLFVELGFEDFRWLDPEKIVTGHWVRMKCMYGCSEYGNNACCPPNTPTVKDCRRFFREYDEAVVFHFAKKVDKPEDRHDWTRDLSRRLLELERRVFISGRRKAFLLLPDSCHFCADCPDERTACKQPRIARPTPEAFCVDVFATVRPLGYPIEVLRSYDQTMNRYSFLMIE